MLIKRYANPYLASQGCQPCINKSGFETQFLTSVSPFREPNNNRVKKNNIGQKTKVSNEDYSSDLYVRKYSSTKYVPRRTYPKNTYRCVLKLLFSSSCIKDVCDSISLTEKYICQLNNFFIQKIDLKPCLLNMTSKQQINNTHFARLLRHTPFKKQSFFSDCFATPSLAGAGCFERGREAERSEAMMPFKKSFTKMWSSKENRLEKERKKSFPFYNAIQLNDESPSSQSVCPFVFLDVRNTCRIDKQKGLTPPKGPAFSGNFVTGNFVFSNAFADILLTYNAVQCSGSYNCHTWHSLISRDDKINTRVLQSNYPRFKKASLFSALNNYYNFYWRSNLFKQHIIKAAQQHTFFSTIRKAPASTRIFTVTRSPFIFKKTREQFALAKNFYYSTIKMTSNMHLQLLLYYLGLIKLPVEFKIMITHI